MGEDLVTVGVDNTGPVVSFTATPVSPTTDTTPSLTVRAEDTVTVAKVEYQVDARSWISASITPATSAVASFTTSALSDGSHTVREEQRIILIIQVLLRPTPS